MRFQKSPPCAGISLVELIIGMVVFGVLLASISGLMNAFLSSKASLSVTYGGNTFEQAPSSNALRSAISLHAALRDQMAAADAVFVLGGERPSPTLSATTYGQPLVTTFLPTSLTAMASVAAGSVKDSWTFSGTNAAQFTPYLETASQTNFTIISLTYPNTVTSITQSRRYLSTDTAGASTVLYEVIFFAGAALTAPGPANPPIAYRFWVYPAEESYAVVPGARHNWFRWDSTWSRFEEAPTTLTFPDPNVVGGGPNYTSTFSLLANVIN